MISAYLKVLKVSLLVFAGISIVTGCICGIGYLFYHGHSTLGELIVAVIVVHFIGFGFVYADE